MTVLFDTSAIVPALVKAHPNHGAAHSCLRKGIKKEFIFLVPTHCVAECFAVLTTLPVSPKIFPSIAQRLLDENIRTWYWDRKTMSLTSHPKSQSLHGIHALQATYPFRNAIVCCLKELFESLKVSIYKLFTADYA